MKKAEITYILIVILILAGLRSWSIIDDASFAWALTAYGLLRGLLNTNNKNEALKRTIKEKDHAIELMDNHITVLKNKEP